MPGRLLNMSTNGANAEGAPSKHVTNGKSSPSGAVQQPSSHSQSQGTSESIIPGLGKAMTNGDHAPYPTPNGVSPSSPSRIPGLPDSMFDLPEEVVHISSDLHSLGDLIQRVSGECFNSLDKLVDDLAKWQIPSANSMTNGASHGGQQPPLSSEDEKRNALKKRHLLQFASEYRAKFIKLLVVTDWTRRDERDVSKLIDLKNWLLMQDDMAQVAANSFFELVRDLRSFKLPNPDLETALAVLAGGDVPWFPHFGFREVEKLSAEETLKVLQRMNTIINMRLVLHEDLIPQLRQYRVADGRATFTFPQEFELDVYVASEDPEQQWYFLDVRFLFDPAPNITGDQLRAMVDSRLNIALAEKGLRGACELAHDFVLTHKINIFMKQARELARGVWAGALRIDMVRRTLTVQYWVESPQAKSWIEIGIASGKDKNRRRKAGSDNAISSQIKARWIRNHKEVKDAVVPVSLEELSVENLVRAHIARHSSHILQSIRDSLEERAAKVGANEERAMQIRLTCSDTEPSDCALHAKIGDHPTTTLQIDGITGRLYFSPANHATPKAQEALERAVDPIAQAPEFMARYMTYEIQVRIDRLIETLGWEIMRHIRITKEDIQMRMKREVHRWTLFQPRGFKGSNWYIAYAINLCGESWWALEITDSTPAPATSQLRLPGSADDDTYVPLSLESLRKLEQSAATASSFIASNRALVAKGVQTALRHVPYKTSNKTSADSAYKTLPVLMIRFSQLIRSRNGRFANEVLQLQYLGFDTDAGTVRLVAKGKMRDPLKVRDILQHTKDPNIAFALDGNFSVVAETKVGTSATSNVIARLNTLGTLCNLAKTLKSHDFECKEISFSKVCFTLADGQEVTLLFPAASTSTSSPTASTKPKLPERIHLEVQKSSALRRIRPLLEEIINDPEIGFERFTTALSYFLPVLRGFQALEKRHAADFPYSPTVMPRQVDYYRLTYPNPSATKDQSKFFAAFDMHFKRNKDELEWRVNDILPGQQREEREKLLPGYHEKLAGFMKRVGKGWTGMRTLLVADKGGIEEAILELDKAVWDAIKTGLAAAGTDDAAVKHEVITID